jgi:hypothetical protein
MPAIIRRAHMTPINPKDQYAQDWNPEAWIQHHVDLASANSHPHALVATIDPDLAAALLKRNPLQWNRKMSPIKAAEWAAAIKSGDWALNGETIIVALTGELNDGQHRLQGCIDAGKPFRSFIVFGVERDTRDTLDQGKRRQTRDLLDMHGYKYTANLGSSAATALGYKYKDLQILDHSRVNAQDILEFVTANPRLTDAENNQTGLRMMKNFKTSPATFAAIYYLLAERNRPVARGFFDSIIFSLGFRHRSDPRLRLIERLRDHGNRTRRLLRSEMLSLSILAWNLFCRGEECGPLAWSPLRDEIPTIDDVTAERAAFLLKRLGKE